MAHKHLSIRKIHRTVYGLFTLRKNKTESEIASLSITTNMKESWHIFYTCFGFLPVSGIPWGCFTMTISELEIKSFHWYLPSFGVEIELNLQRTHLLAISFPMSRSPLFSLSPSLIATKGPFTRCDFSWVRLHFLIKSQSYNVNSIIDIHTTHSMRCKKTQSHSEKIAPCECAFSPNGKPNIRSDDMYV